ncbi:MAG: hypothetical protein JWP03_5170, partial [Phycisphaerales bacterium]|nr:hypothetical protein [Phycisphaerales bacterium]
MRRTLGRARRGWGGLAIGAAICAAPGVTPSLLADAPPKQLSPDDAAAIELNTARRAFNEQKYTFA